MSFIVIVQTIGLFMRITRRKIRKRIHNQTNNFFNYPVPCRKHAVYKKKYFIISEYITVYIYISPIIDICLTVYFGENKKIALTKFQIYR